MPTDELESQLRSTLARAAADFENPEQARQRLLGATTTPGGGTGGWLQASLLARPSSWVWSR